MAISGLTALTPDNYPFNARILQDAVMSATCNLPATATRANTNAIDFRTPLAYATSETINLEFSWTASANGNSVNGTVILQHTSANSDGTANGAAWANIPTIGAVTCIQEGASSTAASSTGFSAANTLGYSPLFKLPPCALQFVRAQVALPANTADLSDSVGTLKVDF